MPRLIQQHVFNNYDPTLSRVFMSIEVGGVSYLVATNPMNLQIPLVGRCLVGAGAWYMYESFLNPTGPN